MIIVGRKDMKAVRVTESTKKCLEDMRKPGESLGDVVTRLLLDDQNDELK